MKALIFSDSHGHHEGMRQVLKMHRDADVFFFLGDGLKDLSEIEPDFPTVMFLKVCGNCDWFCGAETEKEALFTLEGRKILYMHGHTCGVKGGIGRAILEARKQGADAVLFGHTHTPHLECRTDGDKPLYVFNPGSIGRTYGGVRHFGVLEVRENGMLFSHGEV